MLYSSTTPEQKRIAMREGLASGTLQQYPGAFNPLSARLIQEKGFSGVYISGAVLANDLGLPDIGGHQVMDFINEKGIDADVIVVSGEVGIDAAIGALRALACKAGRAKIYECAGFYPAKTSKRLIECEARNVFA